MIKREHQLLLKQKGYKLVGKHSAVKPCTWLHKSLTDKGVCYKEQFYGIKSHRCLQCTPSVSWCKHSCLFCWRPLETTQAGNITDEDSPELIAQGMIDAHKEFIIGYNKAAKGLNETKLKESMNPNQVALSLAGEPTTYTKLGELISEFKKRKMTVFLVTNGSNPEALKNLSDLPTQLYVTLPAPDHETYLRTCAPRVDSWNDILKTLDLMPKIKTRRVIRLTLVRDLNLKDAKGYAELIKRAEPDFVEVKAFMSVGSARERLPYETMPLHTEIKQFSEELAAELNMKILDEKKDSRVCLIGLNNPKL
ncbi:MAG TPA: 4-demethylwyosine synthase TYW1 [Candidatus Nanoarchaeia archaeon]|nr:4-demethylwyosine synthase TYW1 [Candidatus Nanoarchaeia archaeon]